MRFYTVFSLSISFYLMLTIDNLHEKKQEEEITPCPCLVGIEV